MVLTPSKKTSPFFTRRAGFSITTNDFSRLFLITANGHNNLAKATASGPITSIR
jgi:hypothetical protein